MKTSKPHRNRAYYRRGKGGKGIVDVRTSRAHRNRKHRVKGYFMRTSRLTYNEAYMRNPRSTRAQIRRRGGTRMGIRKKKRGQVP